MAETVTTLVAVSWRFPFLNVGTSMSPDRPAVSGDRRPEMSTAEEEVPTASCTWGAAHQRELLALYKMSRRARVSVASSWRFP